MRMEVETRECHEEKEVERRWEGGEKEVANLRRWK